MSSHRSRLVSSSRSLHSASCQAAEAGRVRSRIHRILDSRCTQSRSLFLSVILIQISSSHRVVRHIQRNRSIIRETSPRSLDSFVKSVILRKSGLHILSVLISLQMKLENSRVSDSNSGAKTGRDRITDSQLVFYVIHSPKRRKNRQSSRYRIGEPGVRKALPELP